MALYGTDKLIAERRKDLKNREHSPLTDELIRLREEMSEQIRALEELASWAPPTAATSLAPPQTPAKPCNGRTWATWLP